MSQIECFQGLLLLESTALLLLSSSHLSHTVGCGLTSRAESSYLKLSIGEITALVSYFSFKYDSYIYSTVT